MDFKSAGTGQAPNTSLSSSRRNPHLTLQAHMLYVHQTPGKPQCYQVAQVRPAAVLSAAVVSTGSSSWAGGASGAAPSAMS